jgi:hypothetical protein
MRFFTRTLMVLVLCVAAYPQTSQTEDLGMGAFANDKGAIKLAVDAGLVNLDIKSPYVMFVLYMAAGKENQNIVVARDGVVMIYNGQEYRMPSLEEFHKNYKGEVHDVSLYRHLGKEGLIASWMRFYDFPRQGEFFPPLSLRSQLPRDEGSMYSNAGFRTKCYFKNPGFKRGDTLTIKVTAKNNPQLTGEVQVTLR